MSDDELVLVWKIPDVGDFECDHYHEVGIYPSGELMAICESEEDAKDLVEHLEELSPSERFGDSMEDAPYTFSVSYESTWDNA